MAPPITVASEQKATVCTPSTSPTAASIPLSPSSLMSSAVPSSKNASSLILGLRGSSSRGSFGGFGAAVPASTGPGTPLDVGRERAVGAGALSDCTVMVTSG